MESKFKPNDFILIEFLCYEEPEINHQEYDFLIGIFMELENGTHAKVTIYNEHTKNEEEKFIIKTYPIDSIRKIYSRSEIKTLENINIICSFGLKNQFMELRNNINLNTYRKKSLDKMRKELMSYIHKGNFYDDER